MTHAIKYHTIVVAIYFMIGGITNAGTTVTETIPSNKGWSSPLGANASSLTTNTDYNFDSTVYRTKNSVRHTGVDYVCALDSSVYAISDGTIRAITRSDSATLNESVILVEHRQPSGKVFWATYGHVRAEANWRVGNAIRSSDILGKVKKYQSPVHIHFGINVTEAKISGWGRCPVTTNPTSLGWRDPMPFLASTLNGNLYNYSVAAMPTQGRTVLSSPPALSSTAKFTLLNTGSNTIRKSGFSLGASGANISAYSLSGDIAPGTSGTLSIVFNSSNLTKGGRTTIYYLFYLGTNFDTLFDYYIVK